MDDKEMYESLIKWLKILELSGPCDSALDLSSGVALGELLAQLAPEYSPKVKNIGSDDNWRLKASNLKKIVDSIVLYYNDVLDLSLEAHLKPEVIKIAEGNDAKELEKLLKLILGLAVNCNDKQTYITQIMEMEETVQQNIMKALQDIENIGGSASARNSLNIQNDIKDDREILAQKCHEKENQIAIMIEEKNSMLQEIQKLQIMLEKYENPAIIGDDGTSLGNPVQGSVRYNDLRKQVEQLKNDLILSETVKEDLKMKSGQQEKQIHVLQMKIDELNKASSELSQMKDEFDILREASEKSKIYESQLTTYKKKLEDYNDLKRQLKQYEDRAADYLKQNLQYESEAKKQSGLKGQVELYKKELEELHSKLDSEMQKTVKAEFDLQVMQTKIAGLQRERDNLLTQRDVLQEKVDELRCRQGGTGDEDDSANMSRELFGDNLKEKITRLEAENKALREGQGGQTALSDLLNDANQRNEKLREQLKTANQKILLLKSQNIPEDEKNKNGNAELREICETRERLLEEAQSQITNSHTKVRQLEASLESKNQELSALEAKYRKCLEKAKEMIKGLDSRLLGDHISCEVASGESQEQDVMSVVETRLIASAFYRMALNVQKESVDSRLASLSQGQSFMARQRQPAARKNMNFKK
ncbi:CLUMA_CG015308, isoform A [Clunio marinus]|uniref:Protein hook n=1 Tax=Clunio marinus TaxID=568069 RepID=A0A1J1IRP3_9DIPT|nr:CLUMA_CG015308, isoform A [Clunio marinus]